MTEGSSLSDALRLEDHRFMKLLSEVRAEMQTEIDDLQRELSARGLSRSGQRFSGEMQIRLRMIRNAVERVITLRRQLGKRLPLLLEEHQLTTLEKRMESFVNRQVELATQSTYSTSGALDGAAGMAINSKAGIEAGKICGWARNELQVLRLESHLGLIQDERQMTIFNISNNTIGGMNIGTVGGDTNASIQVLAGQGQGDFSEAIRKLTEGITTSTELQDAQRKEFLEHLSTLSTEVALPPERRNGGRLRSSIASLQAGLGTLAQLASLWSTAVQVLKSLGVLKL